MILDAKPFENFSLIFLTLLARFSRYTSLDYTVYKQASRRDVSFATTWYPINRTNLDKLGLDRKLNFNDISGLFRNLIHWRCSHGKEKKEIWLCVVGKTKLR